MKKLILLTLIISGCKLSDPKAEVGGRYIDLSCDDGENPFENHDAFAFTIIEIRGEYSQYVMGSDTASMKSSLLMWKAKRIN